MLTDANFLQLFRLCQLLLEYLLNVQNYLLAGQTKKDQELLREKEQNKVLQNELAQKVRRGAKQTDEKRDRDR